MDVPLLIVLTCASFLPQARNQHICAQVVKCCFDDSSPLAGTSPTPRVEKVWEVLLIWLLETFSWKKCSVLLDFVQMRGGGDKILNRSSTFSGERPLWHTNILTYFYKHDIFFWKIANYFWQHNIPIKESPLPYCGCLAYGRWSRLILPSSDFCDQTYFVSYLGTLLSPLTYLQLSCIVQFVQLGPVPHYGRRT